MARGTFVGMVWGVLASGLGAGALSITNGPVMQTHLAPSVVASGETQQVESGQPAAENTQDITAADTPKPDAPAPVEPAKAQETPPAEPAKVIPDGDRSGTKPAPEAEAPTLDSAAVELRTPGAPTKIGADTSPLDVPSIGATPTPPAEADVTSAPTRVEVSSDAPELPLAQSEAPGAPSADSAPVAVTEPAQPPVPAVPAVNSALVDENEAALRQDTTEAPDQPPAQQQDQPQEEDVAVLLPTEDSPRPSIGTPANTLTNREPAVTQGRLPSVAGDGTGSGDDAPAADTPGPTGPLYTYAAVHDAPEDLPRMSIILIDDGSGPQGPKAVQEFPFPVTFAIDPSHPNAAEAARAYRALGFEVAALVGFPEGAQPSDVEVNIAAVLDAVPESVAILEDPEGSIQGSREVALQATEFVAKSGHGILMQPKGLNTVQQLAAKNGVPSASLFRDFDAKGQDARVIRRFLDQAAFKAKQDGAVVVLGRLRAETVSALVLWGLQDRAAQVALVPVSVVLTESVAP